MISIASDPIAEYDDGSVVLAQWSAAGCRSANGYVVPVDLTLCWTDDGAAFAVDYRLVGPTYRVVGMHAEMAQDADEPLSDNTLSALERSAGLGDDLFRLVVERIEEIRQQWADGTLPQESTVDELTGIQRRRRVDAELAAVTMFLVGAIGLDGAAHALDVSTMQVRRYLESARAAEET